MRIVILAALDLFIIPLNSFSQDTTAKKPRFEADVEFWMTSIFHPFSPAIHEDRYLSRYPTYLNSSLLTDTLRDTPLKHNAFYAALKTTTYLSPEITIKADFYGEHRGMSYGMYNFKNIVVYPVVQLQVKDSATLFNHKITGQGRAGDLIDLRLDEGLFIYNVDAQGVDASLSTGKWKARFGWLGDFTRGIGLLIDDFGAASLARTFGKNNNTSVTASIVTAAPPGGNLLNFLYYSVSASHTFSKVRLYGQAAIQSSGNKGDFYSKGIGNQSGFVLGANATYKLKKVAISNIVEVRYYGSSFNFYHSDRRIRYRDTTGGLYANTVGEYLYPLRKYDSPFSQWAVFTDYSTCNVVGVSLVGNINFPFSKKTEATLNYDLNYIFAAEDKFYNTAALKSDILYTFFTAGFYFKPIPNLKAGIILTNKGMNLDKSYPTLDQYSRPWLGLRVYRGI